MMQLTLYSVLGILFCVYMKKIVYLILDIVEMLGFVNYSAFIMTSIIIICILLFFVKRGYSVVCSCFLHKIGYRKCICVFLSLALIFFSFSIHRIDFCKLFYVNTPTIVIHMEHDENSESIDVPREKISAPINADGRYGEFLEFNRENKLRKEIPIEKEIKPFTVLSLTSLPRNARCTIFWNCP